MERCFAAILFADSFEGFSGCSLPGMGAYALGLQHLFNADLVSNSASVGPPWVATLVPSLSKLCHGTPHNVITLGVDA